MSAKKTKSFKRKEVSLPLLIGIIGMTAFLTLETLGIFTFANSSIKEEDRVTVDGVANTTQYLTSMVLYMSGSKPGDPTVTLSYDPELNALRVKGALNADGLIVGNNTAVRGSSILGGSGNRVSNRSDNGLIIGGNSNVMNDSIDSVIVGGEKNTVLKSDSVALIGASNTTFPADAQPGKLKEQVFVVGGNGNTIRGSKILVLGAGGNTAGSDSVLMGAGIDAGRVERVFVWSDADQPFVPQKASAFYVNTKHGIGLNTNDPKVQLDIGGKGGKGALKLTQKGGFVDGSGKCRPEYKGLMAYVTAGGKAGFCGCNGTSWVPLTPDTTIQAVCVNMQVKPCTGPKPHTVMTTSGSALPRWDSQANNGNGAWIDVPWVYGGNQGECGYTCGTGYHPDVVNPSGWQQGGCKACTEIAHRYIKGAHTGWRAAGTGIDNCDFGCQAAYEYTNSATERSCNACAIGKWTKDNNQDKCKDCKPVVVDKGTLASFLNYAKAKGFKPLPAGTGEKHFTMTVNSGFKAWTSTGYSETSCQFDCDERFMRTPGTGTTAGKCTFCENGYYPDPSTNFAQCVLCKLIPNMHTWKTNGAINWTGDDAKQIDCDFSCKGGFKYHNNGKNRGCTPCEVGEWTADDNQSTTCNQCTNKPNDPKAYYTGTGTSADCPWACKDGYKKAGGKCVKGEKKNWVNCTPSCNSSCTKTRVVTCFDGNGIGVDLSLCHGSDTATSEVVPGKPCTPGKCGPANGQRLYSEPSGKDYLCSIGYPTSVRTQGNARKWNCVKDTWSDTCAAYRNKQCVQEGQLCEGADDICCSGLICTTVNGRSKCLRNGGSSGGGGGGGGGGCTYENCTTNPPCGYPGGHYKCRIDYGDCANWRCYMRKGESTCTVLFRTKERADLYFNGNFKGIKYARALPKPTISGVSSYSWTMDSSYNDGNRYSTDTVSLRDIGKAEATIIPGQKPSTPNLYGSYTKGYSVSSVDPSCSFIQWADDY